MFRVHQKEAGVSRTGLMEILKTSIACQNQLKLFRQEAHGPVQLLMLDIRLSKLCTRSDTLFEEIIICSIFISVNIIIKFLWHELILDNHSYDQRFSKVNLHQPGL